MHEVSDDYWEAWVTGREEHRYKGGDAPLVAICRAVVASQLGDTVKVPAELFKPFNHAAQSATKSAN